MQTVIHSAKYAGEVNPRQGSFRFPTAGTLEADVAEIAAQVNRPASDILANVIAMALAEAKIQIAPVLRKSKVGEVPSIDDLTTALFSAPNAKVGASRIDKAAGYAMRNPAAPESQALITLYAQTDPPPTAEQINTAVNAVLVKFEPAKPAVTK